MPGMNIEDEERDIEELRQVLNTVAEFMNQVKDLVKEFLETLNEGFSGKRIGEEVAHMYKSLVDAGMPPDKAYELTRRFMEAKLEAMPKASSLVETLRKAMTAGIQPSKPAMPKIKIIKTGEGEKTIHIDLEEGEKKSEEDTGREEE